jgi:ABC-type amino acid transport system permease subunit
MGLKLGLSNDWAYNIIKLVGNYEEVYNRNLGPDTPTYIPRGLNSLYTEGGLLYAPPFAKRFIKQIRLRAGSLSPPSILISRGLFMTGNPTKTAIPFWRDERILNILGQVALFIAASFIGSLIYQNMMAGLARQGTTLTYNFSGVCQVLTLQNPCFHTDRNSSYWQAYLAGLLNTLSVSVVGWSLSTSFWRDSGGVARLSTNFIINRLAAFYLELIRNLSLLVFLIFWYLGVFLKLPRVNQAVIWPGDIILTNRGVGIPWGLPTDSFPTFRLILLVGLILAVGVFLPCAPTASAQDALR